MNKSTFFEQTKVNTQAGIEEWDNRKKYVNAKQGEAVCHLYDGTELPPSSSHHPLSLSFSLWSYSGSLIRKHAKATAGRLHGFEIDKAENNRCQCPWSPQALPEKLIGRCGGVNSKLRIYSRLPACPSAWPVGPVACFLYCSVDDHDNNAPTTATSISTLICFRDTNYRFVQSMKTTRH